LLAVALVISGYYRNRARSKSETIPRRREGGLALLGRFLLILPLLGSIILYTFAPRLMDWAAFAAPAWLRWLGLGMGVLTLPFMVWVFRSIGVNISETVLTKSEHELVSHGPYRWIRHPLYTSGLLLILSLALIAGSWFLLGLWALALLIFRIVVIPSEEANLIAKFGEEYAKYRDKTGALVPRLF
jgi:protein-S-isoprenylcysteine O-methyltransferase Ste14